MGRRRPSAAMLSSTTAMGERRRAVVTGLGAITAAGTGVRYLRRALRGSETRIGPLRLLDTAGLRFAVLAGEIEHVPEPTRMSRSARLRASRSDRLALVAAEEAVNASGLELDHVPSNRIAVAIGSSTGGMLEIESAYEASMRGRPPGRLRAQLLAGSVASPAALVATAFGATGRRLSPSTACSSSAIALAMGLEWIRSGAADVAIVGGTDGFTRMTFSGFLGLHALSPTPCRPFDRQRQGMSLGEGAAILILEAEDHARRRGADMLAELAGAAVSCDATHLTAPHAGGRGAVQALAGALSDARVRPDEVDYVNAHGTGTVQNDLAESQALVRVLGEATARVPVSSTKGLIGHLLGAAGAVEALISVLAIQDGFVPPNFNGTERDPECAIDLVEAGGRERPVRVVASNSYGFGGNNCTVVLRHP
jgi:3-oxoacyl-[acyl-carrier-protein] synthase II